MKLGMARESGRMRRFGRRAGPWRAWCLAAVLHGVPALAADVQILAGPLPFAIRDGRIVRLDVHAVPFAIGTATLDPAAEIKLRVLAEGAAADCFLAAQAIGHVRPGTPGDGDTLVAHALARARAERVQAVLVAADLPAEAVAVLWDYGFTLEEPRVTLCIFRSPLGEACEDKPLPPPEPPVAKAPPKQPARRTAEATPKPPAPRVPPAAPAVGETVARAAITFPADSSFLPRGAEAELRRLLASLPKGPGYAFELVAGIGEGRSDASPDEAARYASWLAQRRLERIAAWLEQHAEIRTIDIRKALAASRPPQAVEVRARPLVGPRPQPQVGRAKVSSFSRSALRVNSP
jgi:outer membrane protein OmpA-like peptidoglycan-associated protein